MNEKRYQGVIVVLTILLACTTFAGVCLYYNSEYYKQQNRDKEHELFDARWDHRFLKGRYENLLRDYERLLKQESEYFLIENPQDIYIFSDSRKYLSYEETTYYAAIVLYESRNPSLVVQYAHDNAIQSLRGRTHIIWDGPGFLLESIGKNNFWIEGLEIGPSE